MATEGGSAGSSADGGGRDHWLDRDPGEGLVTNEVLSLVVFIGFVVLILFAFFCNNYKKKRRAKKRSDSKEEFVPAQEPDGP